MTGSTQGRTSRDGTSVQVRDGRAAPSGDPAQALADGAELVWTALHDASPEDVAVAADQLGFPAELLRQLRLDLPAQLVPGEPARRRRARLIQVDGARALVLLPATYDDPAEQVRLGVLAVLTTDRSVLTLSRGPGPDLDRPQRHPAGTPAAVAHAVLACVLEGYDTVLEGLDDDVTDVEQQVFSEERRSHAKRIYGLKREALELERAVTPLAELGDALHVAGDLHGRVLRVTEHVERLDSLLDSVLSADLAQVGVRQNEDQRTISAWAAIALVPTIVAGIYGMNFQHMPELSWRWGYPGAIALILVVCLGLHTMFRRNGWLGRHREE